MYKLYQFMMFLLLFCITVIVVWCNCVKAETGTVGGIQYATKAHSSITPVRVINLLENNKIFPIARVINKNDRGEVTSMFLVVDVLVLGIDEKDINTIRVLIYKDIEYTKYPLQLVGYTIRYNNGSTKSYKWNTRTDTYEEYNFRCGKFKSDYYQNHKNDLHM